MVDHVHTIVVGAGVVGLAVARTLAARSGEVLIVERAEGIGTQTSSRNSEVIHAGIYYAAGSLKARTCVAGRRRLYQYCREHGVEHQRIGKLLVATRPEQVDLLKDIAQRAFANGLTSPDDALQLLDARALQEREPELRAFGALWSPSTGIVDTHGLMLAYQGDAERAGAALSLHTDFAGACRDGDTWRVRTRGTDGEFELTCTQLVNAGGLHAQAVARSIAGLGSVHVPAARWLKGNYFTVAGKQPPFRHLIYPVPSGGGLGVHLTLDLGGQARFGPDTEPLEDDADEPDYRVDPARAAVFYAAIRDYWPALADGTLSPAYAGIRPKIAGAGPAHEAEDFQISGPAQHGLPGLVNLFGIESPGITASLAIADEVAHRLQ